jgi:hypothetical protein
MIVHSLAGETKTYDLDVKLTGACGGFFYRPSQWCFLSFRVETLCKAPDRLVVHVCADAIRRVYPHRTCQQSELLCCRVHVRLSRQHSIRSSGRLLFSRVLRSKLATCVPLATGTSTPTRRSGWPWPCCWHRDGVHLPRTSKVFGQL